jgi:hypothetical protein
MWAYYKKTHLTWSIHRSSSINSNSSNNHSLTTLTSKIIRTQWMELNQRKESWHRKCLQKCHYLMKTNQTTQCWKASVRMWSYSTKQWWINRRSEDCLQVFSKRTRCKTLIYSNSRCRTLHKRGHRIMKEISKNKHLP